MANDLLFSREFRLRLADYFDSEPVTLLTFKADSGLQDAMPLRDVNEVAVRASDGSFVVYDATTLETISSGASL